MYNVLIVDDEKIVRIGLQTLIKWEDFGCEVVGVAGDGVQALEMIGSQAIDIVITDLKMPKMDGLTLVKKLKEMDFNGGMIVLTNYGEFEMAREALRYGVKDYLLKATLRPHEIMNAIEKTTKDLAAMKDRVRPNRQEVQGIAKEEISCIEALFEDGIPSVEFSRVYQFFFIPQVMSRYQRQDSEKKPFEAYQEAVMNIIKEIMGLHKRIHILFKEESVFVFFEQSLLGEEQLRHMGKQIQVHIKLYTTLDVVAVVGQPFHSRESFRANYESSVVASELVFYRGLNDPIQQVESELVKTYITIEDKVFMKKLDGALRSGEGYQAIELLHQFLSQFEILGVAVKDAKHWLDQLMNRLVLDYGMYFEKHKEILQDLSVQYRRCIQLSQIEGVLSQLITVLSNYTIQVEQEDCREEISKIKRYIHQNWHMKITLNAIATEVNMNESYISRLFKQKTGLNIVNYISMVKMEKAKEMLKDPNMRVKDVANELGFEEQSYFNRMFKKYFGMNPNDYKKME